MERALTYKIHEAPRLRPSAAIGEEVNPSNGVDVSQVASGSVHNFNILGIC